MADDLWPIPDHKSVCQAMAPAGWSYGGFDDGFYMFQSGDYRNGFRLMECAPEDLTRENLARMVQLGVTRVRA